jgi:hypothetical protein
MSDAIYVAGGTYAGNGGAVVTVTKKDAWWIAGIPCVSMPARLDHLPAGLMVWSGDDDAPPSVDEEFEIFGQRFVSAYRLYLPLVVRAYWQHLT